MTRWCCDAASGSRLCLSGGVARYWRRCASWTLVTDRAGGTCSLLLGGAYALRAVLAPAHHRRSCRVLRAQNPSGLDGSPLVRSRSLAALPTPPNLAPLLTAEAVAVALPAACGIAFISILETLLAARVVDDNRCEELCTFFYDEDGEIVLEGEGRPLDV